jgi:hypothetical protein
MQEWATILIISSGALTEILLWGESNCKNKAFYLFRRELTFWEQSLGLRALFKSNADFGSIQFR